MKPKSKGFTLIELLITVTLISILSLLAFMAWQNQASKARDARRKADLKRLTIAFEDYYGDKEAYPSANILTNCGQKTLSPYMAEAIPCDPKTKLPYCYVYDDTAPLGQEYRLLATLENTYDTDIGKLGCAGPENCGFEQTCNESTAGHGFNYGFSSTNIPVLNPDVEPVFIPGSSPSPSVPSGPLPSFDPSGIWACQPNTPPTSAFCNSYPPPGPVAAGCSDYSFSDVGTCDVFCQTAPSQYWCDY